jgi:hypothetical protein
MFKKQTQKEKKFKKEYKKLITGQIIFSRKGKSYEALRFEVSL